VTICRQNLILSCLRIIFLPERTYFKACFVVLFFFVCLFVCFVQLAAQLGMSGVHKGPNSDNSKTVHGDVMTVWHFSGGNPTAAMPVSIREN